MNEERFEEIGLHLLSDARPSEYLERIAGEPWFAEEPFRMLLRLKSTEQSPVHHPEGNAWNHTLLVVDNTAAMKGESSDPRVFMWAALLHDIGKPDTTRLRKGRITSYDHDKAGEKLCIRFLRELTADEAFIRKTAALVRWHMQFLFVVNKLPFADIRGMKSETDVREVALLGMCDRLGRLNVDFDAEKGRMAEFIEAISR